MAQQTEERRLSSLPPVGGGSQAIPGLYIMRLDDMLDAGKSTFPNAQGQYAQRVKCLFEIQSVTDTEADDPDALVGETWPKWATLSMGKKAWLYSLASAILQREIAKDETVTPDDLIDGVVKMHISQREGDNGTETIWTPSAHRATRRASRPVEDDEQGDEPVAIGRSAKKANDPF